MRPVRTISRKGQEVSRGGSSDSFFESHPLRTAKRDEFRRFVRILQLMDEGRHLEPNGLGDIARIAETMNHRKASRFLESSEAIRQPSHLDG